ncbi:response regulator [Chitinophaga parva]|nr:response regulator [Chitinophaga parva]
MSKKINILLADDDVEDRFIIGDAFETIGLADCIQFVEDGEKVLSYLGTIDTPEPLPNLVILDLNMPKLNGTQTLKLLKEDQRYSDIPVIIFSTSLNELEMQECMHLGANSYVIKPVTFDECIDTARRFYNFCKGTYQFPSVQ